jgi:hypothetical protein
VLDTLLRLLIATALRLNKVNTDILEDLYIYAYYTITRKAIHNNKVFEVEPYTYYLSLVELAEDFRTRVIKGYKEDLI